jgi:putative transcriptional regulator
MPPRFVVALAFSVFVCAGGARTVFGQNGEGRITAGAVLVASEKLGDPNFAETVVFILHRDADGGVLGVVLNRPMDVTLAKAFPKLHGASDPVYEGGPVSPDAVQALMRSPEKLESADHVLGDIYSVARKALLEKSITDRVASTKFRVYLGYAGWGPGQLENEIRIGAWTTLRGAKYAFDSDPASLWERLNRETHSQVAANRVAGQEFRLLAVMCGVARTQCCQ